MANPISPHPEFYFMSPPGEYTLGGKVIPPSEPFPGYHKEKHSNEPLPEFTIEQQIENIMFLIEMFEPEDEPDLRRRIEELRAQL